MRIGDPFADPVTLPAKHGSGRRPRLLFLAWFFPPARAIASVRAFNIAKYLTRLGWEVTTVTPKPSLWRECDDPEEVEQELEREGVRRILTDHRWRFLSSDNLRCWNQGLGWFAGGSCRRVARYFGIDDFVGWGRPAVQACLGLSANDADIVLATGGPFIAFSLAKRISARLGQPYVLDYRDPWSDNPHVSAPPAPALIEKERKLLAGCAAVTIVSPSWGRQMDQRFKLGSKLHVITNGYSPEEIAEVRPYDFGHSAIVYSGELYPPKRTITSVMRALKRLNESPHGRNAEWRFHYYGASEPHVREEAERLGVRDQVVFHGKVSRKEALSAVRGAAVAVVICSVFSTETPGDQGIIPGKLFEPLGLGVPILLIAPAESDARKIVEETESGQGFLGGDVEGMVRFILKQSRAVTGSITRRDAYSWLAGAGKLDRILRDVIRAKQTTDPETVGRRSGGH